MFIPDEPFATLFSEYISEAASLRVFAILIGPSVPYDAVPSGETTTNAKVARFRVSLKDRD
jgi:hypothetical protein